MSSPIPHDALARAVTIAFGDAAHVTRAEPLHGDASTPSLRAPASRRRSACDARSRCCSATGASRPARTSSAVATATRGAAVRERRTLARRRTASRCRRCTSIARARTACSCSRTSASTTLWAGGAGRAVAHRAALRRRGRSARAPPGGWRATSGRALRRLRAPLRRRRSRAPSSSTSSTTASRPGTAPTLPPSERADPARGARTARAAVRRRAVRPLAPRLHGVEHPRPGRTAAADRLPGRAAGARRLRPRAAPHRSHDQRARRRSARRRARRALPRGDGRRGPPRRRRLRDTLPPLRPAARAQGDRALLLPRGGARTPGYLAYLPAVYAVARRAFDVLPELAAARRHASRAGCRSSERRAHDPSRHGAGGRARHAARAAHRPAAEAARCPWPARRSSATSSTFLRAGGIDEVVINLHHLGQLIEQRDRRRRALRPARPLLVGAADPRHRRRHQAGRAAARAASRSSSRTATACSSCRCARSSTSTARAAASRPWWSGPAPDAARWGLIELDADDRVRRVAGRRRRRSPTPLRGLHVPGPARLRAGRLPATWTRAPAFGVIRETYPRLLTRRRAVSTASSPTARWVTIDTPESLAAAGRDASPDRRSASESHSGTNGLGVSDRSSSITEAAPGARRIFVDSPDSVVLPMQ